MLTGKHASASNVAAAVEQGPILGFLNPDFSPMVTALERKLVANSSLLAQRNLYLLITVHDIDDRGPSAAFARE